MYTFWQETDHICRSYIKTSNGPKFADPCNVDVHKGEGGQRTIISLSNLPLLFHMLIWVYVQILTRKRQHFQKLRSNPWNIHKTQEHNYAS